MIITSRATARQKVRAFIRVFDADEDGALDRLEFGNLLTW
jgi:hypothetical protein